MLIHYPPKKNIGTVQRAPHPTARKHPQRNAQKATLMKRGRKGKGPANSSRESRPRHRKIYARKEGALGKSKIQSSLHHQTVDSNQRELFRG